MSYWSHPTWVRGLKHRNNKDAAVCTWSHPTWVRGLKPRTEYKRLKKLKSHPTWVRGLKHLPFRKPLLKETVAPYVGAWIETKLNNSKSPTATVAPYVGAWIETRVSTRKTLSVWSHPTWVRGLKLSSTLNAQSLGGCTQRGGVD